MQVADIVPSASELGDAEREHIYARMCEMWGLEPRDASHNPCPLAAPVTRATIEAEAPADFLVTPKTDGVRYVLVLTTRADGRAVAVLAGRDMRMYEIEVWAPDVFFERGCVIDGELAWAAGADIGRLVYFAFDCVCIGGERVRDRGLVDRIGRLDRALTLSETQVAWIGHYKRTGDASKLEFIPEEGKVVATDNNSYGLTLRPKPMLRTAEWARRADEPGLWGAHVGVAADGYIFTPLRLPVYVNSHRRMYKWKPPAKLTVDVEVTDGAVGLTSATGEVADVAEIEGRQFRLATPDVDSGIFECQLAIDAVLVALTPVRRRHDKTMPNSIETAAATVRSGVECVGVDDLLAWAARGETA